MNPNQRSEANNQSNNGGNELAESSSRAFSKERAAQDKTATAGNSPSTPATGKSNDVAGSLPQSPRGHGLAADQKMDDDSGLSNTANRDVTELDQQERQERQSNVGRRSDGTPD